MSTKFVLSSLYWKKKRRGVDFSGARKKV